jgi:hypothetical protein
MPGKIRPLRAPSASIGRPMLAAHDFVLPFHRPSMAPARIVALISISASWSLPLTWWGQDVA